MLSRLLWIAPFFLLGCGETAPRVVDAAPEPTPTELAGDWAAEPALCGRAEWRITVAAITADNGVACALGDLSAHAGSWTAEARCVDGRGGVVELNSTDGNPDTLVISGTPFAAPIDLVRCPVGAGVRPERDPHAPLEAASEVDVAIASNAAGVVGRVDEENAIVREAWWRDGELIKLVEPRAGRAEAPRRSYYFRPGEREPFLVRTPTGALAFEGGRLMTAFSAEGEILGELERQRLEAEALRATTGAEIAQELAATLKPEDAGARAAPGSS